MSLRGGGTVTLVPTKPVQPPNATGIREPMGPINPFHRHGPWSPEEGPKYAQRNVMVCMSVAKMQRSRAPYYAMYSLMWTSSRDKGPRALPILYPCPPPSVTVTQGAWPTEC